MLPSLLTLTLLSFLPFTLAVNASYPLAGPLTDSIFADPGVIHVGPVYYAYATQNAVSSVPIAISTDFESWTVLPYDVLPHAGAWAKPGKAAGIWAPDVIQSPAGHFIMYYTAIVRGSKNGARCIGAARADNPEGPFVPMDKPVVCGKGSKIDPGAYISPDGSHYLLWREQLPRAHIMMQHMMDDGVTPRGAPVKLIQSTKADGWNTEAPSLVKVEGTFYLFFSTQPWQTTKYTVSVATASKIEGPYTRHQKPVLFTGGEGSAPGDNPVAPGGADVMFAPQNIKALDDGWSQLNIVFHAAKSKQETKKRYLWNGLLKAKGTQVEVV